MKKINLKNILKKTFKKSSTKKIKKKKINKIKKKTKKTKGKIIKKIIKKKPIKKVIVDKSKNDNLRIAKSIEQKPEIKKIKKQETAKREYKPKDYVVYPKHGVGQILSVSSKTIGEIEVQCYEIKFEKDKAIGLLPINKQIHLRALSTINQVNKSIYILKSKPKIKRSMWSRRAQEYEAKISSGKIYEPTEQIRMMVKDGQLFHPIR